MGTALLGEPGMCKELRKAKEILDARGLDLEEVLRGALAIAEKGGTQAQVNAYARDYERGKAKPIEAYL